MVLIKEKKISSVQLNLDRIELILINVCLSLDFVACRPAGVIMFCCTIQGKRSTSDHMHQALNYIKQMQKNVQELEKRRDGLKTPSSSSSSHNLEKTAGSSPDQKTASSPNFVSVDRCRDGVEILINCVAGERSSFPLSKVLRTLQNEGVNVVSCDSTKADNRLLHRVQSEVYTMEKQF